MPEYAFRTPLTVLVGLGFPKEIRSIMDAIGYLDEQPSLLRDEAFHAARDVCRDALYRAASVEEARNVFCALVRRRGVLIEENWADPLLSDEGHSLGEADGDKQVF